jgi:putative nucleotidyltransferase with HDIG domain
MKINLFKVAFDWFNFLLDRILYRYRQFCSTINPKVNPSLLAEARAILPPEWRKIFDRHTKPELAHILRMYNRIKTGEDIPEAEKPELLILALIHDIGKTVTRPTLFEKIVKTILPIPNRAHSAMGAKILQRLGAPRILIKRVRDHHKEGVKDPLLAFFQKLDDSL